MESTTQSVADQMTVAVASDHGGVDLKNCLRDMMADMGLTVVDLGTNGTESVDYPDYAKAMADAIAAGKAERGLLVCGTGIGISIAANRYNHIRAALVHDAFGAKMCRQHNDANVLVLGGRTIGEEVAKDCLRLFLETEFEGGRHQRRVSKLTITD